MLVVNDSKVLNAKLVGRKKTGGMVELLVLKADGLEGMCLIRGRKLKAGTEIEIGEDIRCIVTEKLQNGFKVKFNENTNVVMERYGEAPLPHYIKKHLPQPERYQTVYAKHMGSVAAPTAGLHFTEKLLKEIEKKGVNIARLTLHIGPSTFLPIREGTSNGDDLPPERFSIDKKNARIINKGIQEDSLIAVGTSTVKALESASQGDRIVPGEGLSELFISPGYKFKIPLKGLITNFHLPRSSLLLLVCALFGRERMLEAYGEAVSRGYRFYSFGDAMFIMR